MTRLVARTMSLQLSDAVQASTAPFHCSAGLIELIPQATFGDLHQRNQRILRNLISVDGGRSIPLSFRVIIYGFPSSFLWEDSTGTVQKCRLGVMSVRLVSW